MFAGLTSAPIALISDLIIIWAFFPLAPSFRCKDAFYSLHSFHFFSFYNSQHSASFECVLSKQDVDFLSLPLTNVISNLTSFFNNKLKLHFSVSFSFFFFIFYFTEN